MKTRNGAVIAQLAPAPEGWRAEAAGGVCVGATIAEVCEKLPAGIGVSLLLPSSAVVTERFVLPEAPREDLLAMAQLQLEKLLPYTADDFVFDLEELGPADEGVRVLAVTVPLAELKRCAEPLRNSSRPPAEVGVYAVQVARSFAGKGVALALWQECSVPVLMVAVDGKLVWLEGLLTDGAGPDATDIARSLLGAELAGALPGPVTLARVGASDWLSQVRAALPGVPVEDAPITPAAEIAGNWVPASWLAEAQDRQKQGRFVNRLQWAFTAYAAVLAVGFGWLAFEKKKVGRIDSEIAELQPKVELSNARQTKWRALEAAVEPSRYLVEILHQIARTIGAADIRITEFQMSPKEFAFSGEAANVAEVIEYVVRLRKEPDLVGFKIDSPNPNILPNERAQFRVSGRVDSPGAKR
jgi:hypothetical protein